MLGSFSRNLFVSLSYAPMMCGRYVYQKAYVEFFASPANFKALEPRLKASPAITYMAVNAKGDFIANVGPNDVNAVTWGVFPAKEVIQPTVVDPQSFNVWKVCMCPAAMSLSSPCLLGGDPPSRKPRRPHQTQMQSLLLPAYDWAPL
jgi:hypothetical protein